MNRYFLLIATMQLWPAIAPVNPWSTWGPLIVIVVISAARELNDDVKRGKADDAYNAVLKELRKYATKKFKGSLQSDGVSAANSAAF